MRWHLALAQDLSARICHDLGGPLGGVATALDLLSEEPEAAGIARDGAEVLNRRLRLWRAVAGAGTGDMGTTDMAALLEGAPSCGRVAFDLSGLTGDTLPAATAQALLAAAMLAAEALPRGGVVRLAGGPPEPPPAFPPAPGAQDRGPGFAVWPDGRDAAWPPALPAVLAGEEAPGPQRVLAPLLLSLADAAGLSAALALGETAAAAPPLLLRPA